jgi:hypothetical protein
VRKLLGRTRRGRFNDIFVVGGLCVDGAASMDATRELVPRLSPENSANVLECMHTVYIIRRPSLHFF